MNRAEIIGNLTRDPEVRFTSGATQIAVCRFAVAVKRISRKEGQPEADFLNCVAFGKTAETIGNYFTKGRKIAVYGRIQSGSYVKDDEKRYYTEIAVEGFDFCDSKSADNAPQSEPAGVEYSEDAGEDLPF
jgi:single-strand DNA-binding protein